jgi:hypothetical protein
MKTAKDGGSEQRPHTREHHMQKIKVFLYIRVIGNAIKKLAWIQNLQHFQSSTNKNINKDGS